MTNEQLKQSAKDEAARELYECTYKQALIFTKNYPERISDLTNRAMEIYAEKVNDKSYWCIVKYSKHTPLYYCGYFGKYNGTELLPAISSDFEKAVKCLSRESAELLLSYLKKHAPITSENFIVEEHMYAAKTQNP